MDDGDGLLAGEPDAGVLREGGPADLVPLSDPAALWRVGLVH